ncbi:putative polysaccharide biosynthesis protein [Roseburia inulinivorans]|jgi:stage V sporulation protein B|uniref:Polysaccharide biosynthesis protein n=1 Tax=Roseburia inulinivorans TaxID=360807 RepID=A0A3R6DQ24_9FIRM|nr:polysaccharide biosynthesis protein [Roseburia inulinivorans]RHA91687.1 polysaccharide biosynthesis protein [Roseburia inulinivorans]
MSNKKSSTSFLVQGSILAMASIISRIIGLVYRIPLTAIIGNKGNDYYGCAFEIYNILLIISSYSLPLAVSKLVSADMSLGRKKNVYRILKCALIFGLVSGTIAALILFFGAEFITGTIMKTPYSIFAVKVLVPTLIVVAVLGVMRGFFQGLGTMMPSAVSQILEQIANAIVSVWAAYVLYSYGTKVGAVLGNTENYAAAYGAAGGTLGTGTGAVVGLLFASFVLVAYLSVFKRQMKRERRAKVDSYSYIFKILFITIIPVLMSTTIYNCNAILDQAIFKNIANLQGYSANDISEWNGIYTGKYKTLINVPISIASALAASSVPALTAAYTNGKKEAVRSQINTAIRFIMVVAFPCAVGMGVLASPILQLLFRDSSELAASMLQLGAVSIVFFSLSTLSNGLLQGINRMREPVKNALIALVLHIGLLVVLMYAFQLNIYAVVYANAFFGLLMCVLNAYSVKKYSGYRQEIRRTFVIPGISALIMGVAVYLSYQLALYLFRVNAIATVFSIFIGVIVYAVVLLLLKGLTEEEILKFPKGAALVRLARKMHLLR